MRMQHTEITYDPVITPVKYRNYARPCVAAGGEATYHVCIRFKMASQSAQVYRCRLLIETTRTITEYRLGTTLCSCERRSYLASMYTVRI